MKTRGEENLQVMTIHDLKDCRSHDTPSDAYQEAPFAGENPTQYINGDEFGKSYNSESDPELCWTPWLDLPTLKEETGPTWAPTTYSEPTPELNQESLRSLSSTERACGKAHRSNNAGDGPTKSERRLLSLLSNYKQMDKRICQQAVQIGRLKKVQQQPNWLAADITTHPEPERPRQMRQKSRWNVNSVTLNEKTQARNRSEC